MTISVKAVEKLLITTLGISLIGLTERNSFIVFHRTRVNVKEDHT